MIFQEIYQSSFSQSKHLRRTDYDSWLKEVKWYLWKRRIFWLNIETASNPNSNRHKNCGRNAEGRAGEVPGWHLPCLTPLGPFPCACRSAGVRLAGQAECSESPSSCGRWAFSSAGWGSIPELLFMAVPWHKLLGVSLVLAADNRKCFGIFVLFLMNFSYCIWRYMEKLIWTLWVFFYLQKISMYKS